jgi:uncharacterized protein DUF3551
MRIPIRVAFIALVTVAAALAADVSSSQAQESFFNKRFCTQGGGDRGGSGVPDCSFNTWQQCIESARGLGRYCTENPFFRGNRQEPGTQGRGRRQRDQ